jgi:hypothetical protein
MSALHRPILDPASGRIVITAPELRDAAERCATTANGTAIGRSHSRVSREPVAISGPHRAPATLGDRAVRWACVVALVFLVVLIGAERLA